MEYNNEEENLDQEEETPEEGKGTYIERMSCSNCSFHGDVEIEKGKSLVEVDCPRCETKSLRKSVRGTVKKELDNIFG